MCYILLFCFRSGKPSFENCCIQNSQFMKWSSKIKAKHFTSREHNKFLEVECDHGRFGRENSISNFKC